MGASEGGGKSFARRDRLLEIEKAVRAWWEEGDVFRAEPGDSPPQPGQKFFGNFPFPYMNGFLHLGHAFSLSKLEFAASYHRLTGANILLPFAFHCTGMPIKASADKLAREIQQFGNPPVFPDPCEWLSAEESRPQPLDDVSNYEGERSAKHKGNKSKAKAKSGGQMFQWEIMRSFGLSDTEIARFQDPYEWLKFFPPLAVEDLKAFGLGCDWRRSFVTTDMNPFFDSFVKWQVRKLKTMGKITKDVRYTIFSPLDGQPCADHDRAVGEGVQPQECTIIKMEVMKPFSPKFGPLEGKRVFLAATLRPDTMYGQTTAWVLPVEKYGAFEINETDVFILTGRAALNLAYQNFSRVHQKPTCLLELTGYDLIGLALESPLSICNPVYALPMSTILIDKGTGIETSVPSDAGRKVNEVEPVIKTKLIESGKAIIYSEPEKKVMSRTGDECVVALTDQWYITYGEAEWKKLAEECLSSMSLYSDETRHGFEQTLCWLNQWAGSRSFGLGTRIPWDQEFLVESLSDSTVYMAYYTVAHILQNGDMYGGVIGRVKPSQMTDEVWDYLFCGGPFPISTDIPSSLLDKMKKEFEYWYPFDLRVSGKDLIQNHLTFCIYNHTAIMSKQHWPRGFRCNGHITLNSEKMSKSTGNFRTLRQAIEEFSADATRFCLADSGDGVDDANFEFKTANSAILRLTKEPAWMEQVLDTEATLRTGPPSSFADRVFENEINIAVKTTEQNYKDYMFREALKTGFYDLQTARDVYRLSCDIGEMNHGLVWRFMDVQTRLIAPICPHYAEYVWRELLRKKGFVIKAGWPAADSPNPTLQKANKYLQASIASFREKHPKNKKKGSKKGNIAAVPKEVQWKGLIYVNEQFDGWKAECLKILQSKFDVNTKTFPSNVDMEILAALKKMSVDQSTIRKFLTTKKKEAKEIGVHALDLKLPFGEIQVLEENLDVIKLQLGVEDLEVVSATDPGALAKDGFNVPHPSPDPGSPTPVFLPR